MSLSDIVTNPNPTPFAAMRLIREKLGCGLGEAKDFYMLDPSTFAERLQKKVEHHKATNTFYESNEDKIRQAIRRYYLALDQRKHGGLAQNNAFHEIEDILGMTWVQGQELAKVKP